MTIIYSKILKREDEEGERENSNRFHTYEDISQKEGKEKFEYTQMRNG